MNFVLSLKHWQVFLIFLVGSITSNFTWEGRELLTLGFNSVGLIIYFFWYFAVGLELTEHLPSRVNLSRNLFIFNAFVLLISRAVIELVFDGHYSTNELPGFLWILYLMFALFQFIFYPSKALRSIEIAEEANFSEYIGYFLMILLWPFGIWWIQPKLNKINGR